MSVAYSPFWTFFFIFQMLLCLFGVFSQNVFMKTTVWDQKIHSHGRVHLFYLSIGYQLILTTFVAWTSICMISVGSMFEVEECRTVQSIPLKIHNFGEFTIVISHLLINLDRLMLAIRPHDTRGRASNVYFYVSLLVSFALSASYVELARHSDIRNTIAFVAITSVNVLNLLIEIKLFYYTNFVYRNTIGLVPLERRFELSTSVTMIRCFLPASVCGLLLRFTALTFYSFSHLIEDPTNLPPFYFVLNLFWNLDCALFPWFFILFHPRKKEKLKRFLRIRSSPILNNAISPARQMQHEHFNQFKTVWKVEI